MKFHLYCAIWNQCNQYEKVKKDFPAASSKLPFELGTLDASMPNVIFLPGTTANEISRLCTTKFLSDILIRNW